MHSVVRNRHLDLSLAGQVWPQFPLVSGLYHNSCTLVYQAHGQVCSGQVAEDHFERSGSIYQ